MNDETVIRAIRNREETAIRHVIDKYSRLLWTVVDAVLGGSACVQDVEECVADVFIYLWEHPEKYDPRRGTLKSWLALVARSRALDRWRALQRRSTLPLDELTPIAGGAGVADGLLAEETKSALREALKRLSPEEQDILTRRYYHEQKPREIALALGVSVKQVNNHLYRAKQKLKTEMRDLV